MPYQEASVSLENKSLYDACKQAMHVVTTDGRILRGGQAGLFILDIIGYRKLAWCWSLPGISWTADVGYWLMSKNRGRVYRWFWKKRCRELFAKVEKEEGEG